MLRALILNNIKDASQIKATGFKGTLTKGDVLAYAGKISSAHGSLKDIDSHALPGGEKQLAKQVSEREVDLTRCQEANYRRYPRIAYDSPATNQKLHQN